MNNIIYNGQSLRDLGFAVKNHPVHSVADRDLEFASVIGRSGDYIVDNYRYKNVDIPPYEINMLDFDRLQNTDENERRLIDWLMTGDGSYKRFEDSTVPGYFCKAICTNIGEIQRNDINGFLNTSLQFNREPFWYSNEGQNVIEFEGSRTDFTIINPERYYSEPYIKITPANYSSGIGETDLLVNGIAYKFNQLVSNPSVDPFIEIDSEKADVFCGNTDKNTYARFDYFPILQPGENTISIWVRGSSGASIIFDVQIIPRWRRL